jgi:phosphoribosyl-ATP pyrophosphohydrolase/phosphoribosyl-AMP cyclohydrolase/histidinol dehydrogenase
MAALVLPSATFDQAESGKLSGPCQFVGRAFVSIRTYDEALRLLQQTAGLTALYLEATSISSPDEIISLLDAGAATVIVNRRQLDAIDIKQLDQDRLALLITGSTKEEIIEAIGETSLGIFTSNVTDVGLVEAWLQEIGTEHPPVYVSFSSPTEEYCTAVAKLGAVPVIPTELLSLETSSSPSYISLPKLLLAGATSDRPDGLFTTLVTDERGIALGLVYSSEKSVEESLRTGRGVYQSRKRGLWYKGETSGDIQELVRVSLDCDSDCLQFVVRQKGKGEILHPKNSSPFDSHSEINRFLPPWHSHLLRPVFGTVETPENTTEQKALCPRRFLHLTSLQRPPTIKRKDNGRSKRTVRSPGQRTRCFRSS